MALSILKKLTAFVRSFLSDTELPKETHFAHQCSGTSGRDFSDEADGYHEPPWLLYVAFQPTETNPSVSGSWVERVDGDFEVQLDRVRRELANSIRTVKSTHQLAVIQVQIIVDLGSRYDRDLHVLLTPDLDAGLPSHSEIRGIQPEDLILQQKLADASDVVAASLSS